MAAEYLEGIARMQAAQIRTMLAGVESSLARIARSPELQGLLLRSDEEAWTALLGPYAKGSGLEGGASGLLVYNAFGNPVFRLGYSPFIHSVSPESFFFENQRLRPSLSHLYSTDPGKGHVVMSYPIEDKSGFFAGSVLAVLDLEDLQYLSKDIRFGGSGYGYLVDGNGYILTHPDPGRIGSMTENRILAGVLSDLKSGKSLVASIGNYEYRGFEKVMVSQQIEGSSWLLAVVQNQDEAPGLGMIPSLGTAVLTFLALGMIALLLRTMVRRFVHPLEQLVVQLEDLTQGRNPGGQVTGTLDLDFCRADISVARISQELDLLSQTQESLQVLSWSWNPVDDQLVFSRACQNLWDWDWKGLTHLEALLEKVVAVPDRKPVAKRMHEALDSLVPSTFTFRTHTYPISVIQCTLGPIMDQAGTVVGLAGTMQSLAHAP